MGLMGILENSYESNKVLLRDVFIYTLVEIYVKRFYVVFSQHCSHVCGIRMLAAGFLADMGKYMHQNT